MKPHTTLLTAALTIGVTFPTHATPLTKNRYNNYVVNTIINNSIPATMVVDTGASMVQISQDVANSLKAKGELNILGKGTVTLANGSEGNTTYILLRSISVGDKTAYNVKATIGDNSGTDMFLGQTFLQSFKLWSINNETSEITFEDKTSITSLSSADIPPLSPTEINRKLSSAQILKGYQLTHDYLKYCNKYPADCKWDSPKPFAHLKHGKDYD
jgi:clan AA aspartic protease (TIGR02281 family)